MLALVTLVYWSALLLPLVVALACAAAWLGTLRRPVRFVLASTALLYAVHIALVVVWYVASSPRPMSTGGIVLSQPIASSASAELSYGRPFIALLVLFVLALAYARALHALRRVSWFRA